MSAVKLYFPSAAERVFELEIELKKEELRRARDRFHRVGRELVTLERNRTMWLRGTPGRRETCDAETIVAVRGRFDVA